MRTAALFLLCGLLAGRAQDPASEEQEYFIRQIFDLYGDNSHLSFEGFEHLMENLGLGGLKFDKRHNMSMHKGPGGSFVEVHDELNLHRHNHSDQPRHARSVPPSHRLQEGCLSPEQLLLLYGLEPSHRVAISPKRFMQICPAIVYQLDRRACAQPIEDNVLDSLALDKASLQAWVGASVSILVISVSGLIGVAVVPFLERTLFHRLLSCLVALAVGTLCGDALLHLLPHAYGIDDDPNALMKSTGTFLVLIMFFAMEAFIHGKEHSKKKKKQKSTSDYSRVDKDIAKEISEEEGIGSVAWMVISGDGLHNLTDGLAVGAAFRADMVAGLATAVAVLTHELPHELGDFAVLLKAGMSVRQAIFYNIFSSILSIIGMAAGVVLGNIECATSWIYCATAGSFLYIGLADLVPEMHKYRAKGDVLNHLVLQLAGMLTGGAVMFLIAMYEHSLHKLMAGQHTD